MYVAWISLLNYPLVYPTSYVSAPFGRILAAINILKTKFIIPHKHSSLTAFFFSVNNHRVIQTGNYSILSHSVSCHCFPFHFILKCILLQFNQYLLYGHTMSDKTENKMVGCTVQTYVLQEIKNIRVKKQ